MSYEAVAFRACAFETPLWAFPNLVPGRWNRAGERPVQYLSLHPMTPWAELLRNLHLRTVEEARELRLPIWAIRARLDEEPLEIGFADAKRHGLTPADLIADDRTRCQELADTLVAAGHRSILVPSAALPGTRNLVLFDPALVIDYDQTPLDAEDVPTALVSRGGRCPEGLWGSVHHLSAAKPHSGLQAFEDGNDFAFTQPPVTATSLAPV